MPVRTSRGGSPRPPGIDNGGPLRRSRSAPSSPGVGGTQAQRGRAPGGLRPGGPCRADRRRTASVPGGGPPTGPAEPSTGAAGRASTGVSGGGAPDCGAYLVANNPRRPHGDEVPGHLADGDLAAVGRHDAHRPADARLRQAAGGVGQGHRPLPHRRQPRRGWIYNVASNDELEMLLAQSPVYNYSTYNVYPLADMTTLNMPGATPPACERSGTVRVDGGGDDEDLGDRHRRTRRAARRRPAAGRGGPGGRTRSCPGRPGPTPDPPIPRPGPAPRRRWRLRVRCRAPRPAPSPRSRATPPGPRSSRQPGGSPPAAIPRPDGDRRRHEVWSAAPDSGGGSVTTSGATDSATGGACRVRRCRRGRLPGRRRSRRWSKTDAWVVAAPSPDEHPGPRRSAANRQGDPVASDPSHPRAWYEFRRP